MSPRARLATLLLSRVAGPDAARARARIHSTPGPRRFAPGSPVTRVHGDASMFVGGVRALLLQSLHPAAMAAVDDHSGYRADPWGRLQRTATFIATTTFATVGHADQAAAVVRAVHARIEGTTPDGQPYRADDPHLLQWVHVAEVESFLQAHQRFGRRPLTPSEQDEYVAQAARIGQLLGAPDLPRTVDELGATLRSYRPELRGTPAAVRTGHFLLHDPPIPRAVRPAYRMITGAGVGLLPSWARAELDLGEGMPVLRRVGGHLATRTIRWALDPAQPAPPPDASPVPAPAGVTAPAGGRMVDR
ncbi:oxygenase MpaB family protein [Cellulomonas bogoriensis]|uniref:oxygenase MpaB family protein n=1 Tax=Cellulomonas bogoriensis TaxID=301388 RepID=UPI001E2F9B5F|nr:oxygenase MpaB family protein [Cellulomonas bogoriensis]